MSLSGTDAQLQQEQQQLSQGDSMQCNDQRLAEKDVSELDQQFALKAACIENAFKRMKQWTDYVREVCQWVEKLCALSSEYHQRVCDTMSQLQQSLVSGSSSSMPLQPHYVQGAAMIEQHCRLCAQTFGASVPQIVYEALRSCVKEQEAERRRLKAEWAAAERHRRKALQAMQQARQQYYQRCVELQRARADYDAANERCPGVLVSGPSGPRVGQRVESRMQQKRRLVQDCAAKREAAGQQYHRAVGAINDSTEACEAKKVDILRAVRELVERGDQCFISATCGFFECYARTRDSGDGGLRSLSRDIHQSYRPGSCYRQFAADCVCRLHDSPAPARYEFEEFSPRQPKGSQGRSDGNACDTEETTDSVEDEEAAASLHADIVRRCIRVIDRTGVHCSGIYRKQAAQSRVQQLSTQLLQGVSTDLSSVSPHTVCGLLKHHLRQLPEALLSGEQYDDFVAAGRDGADAGRLSQLVAELPPWRRRLSANLFRHLRRVALRADANQMCSRNLSLVLAPTLLRRRLRAGSGVASVDDVVNCAHHTAVTQALIDLATHVFGSEADPCSSEADPCKSATDPCESATDAAAAADGCGEARAASPSARARAASDAAFDPGVDFDDIDTDGAGADGRVADSPAAAAAAAAAAASDGAAAAAAAARASGSDAEVSTAAAASRRRKLSLPLIHHPLLDSICSKAQHWEFV